jgi:group I intron endonuclease
MLIYKATNKINGKVYIGQTVRTLEARKSGHVQSAKKGSKNHFHRAIRKYGIDNFDFEVVCEATTKEELNELEKYYIKYFNCIEEGYNMVADGHTNIMFNAEARAKHDAKMRTDEVRTKISNSMKEYRKQHPFTESHKKKLSDKAKGNHNFGNGDTRSVGCYCVVDGKEHHFHNFIQAGKWWYENYHPFPYSYSVYKSKIKMCISKGYCFYGRPENRTYINNIRWYLEEVVK